jgi:hypothetical protein
MNTLEQALQVVEGLHTAGVIEQYALGGAIGAAFYIEAVNTADVDIFAHIPPEKASSLAPFQHIHEALSAKGYNQWEKEGVIIHGWPVQFLPATSSLEKEALSAAVRKAIGSIKPLVLASEHLIALAVRTGRPKDKLRVLKFLETPDSYAPEKLQLILEAHGLYQKFLDWKQELRPVTKETLWQKINGPRMGL